MKGKIFLIVAAIVVALALTAFVVFPTNEDEKVQKVQTTEDSEIEDVDEENGYPCPCSQLLCPYCHGDLEWSAKAYKEYTGRKCQICNGSGWRNGKDCEYCDDGREFNWKSGCKCRKCGEGSRQPNCN